jgi:ribosomal protein L11 methyltransferase
VQISVRAHPTALDAVANFLIERGSPGVVIKKGQVQGYYRQDADPAGVSREIQCYLRDIKPIFPKLSATGVSWRRLKDRNWNVAWQRFFTPQRIGRSLLVCPPWLEPPALRDRHLISIEPGLAFGTGTHATTRGCIEFLERAARSLGARKFTALDVGTGSGILAITLVRLGAKRVWAIDNDPTALQVARQNLLANGTVQNVRLSPVSVDKIRRSFSVVVANLTAETISALANPLAKRVTPRGFLVLSGILHRKAPDVKHCFYDLGFHLLRRKREKEWVTMLWRRS